MAAKDLKNAKIKIQDGTATTPNSIEIVVGEGNLTWSVKNPLEYRKNRGKLGSVRKADEEPVEVSIEAEFDFVISDTGEPVTVTEALTKTGAASSWVTTSTDACEPYAVDLIVEFEPECDDGTLAERITFPNFRPDNRDYDIEAGQISIPGKCNVLDIVAERYDPNA